jgi:pimeloyl-ACP methyl ester carboxylesterase
MPKLFYPFLSLIAVLGSVYLSPNAYAINPRPADWISNVIPISDSRSLRIQGSRFQHPRVEIIEIPYSESIAPQATLFLVPGLFQNSASFDLIPEHGVSIARYLMKNFHLKILMLHVRGLGYASDARKLNLDDFAIDDIPAGIQWAKAHSTGPLYVMGHSQGAITLQASLSGVTRCELGNCFKPDVAKIRQTGISGLALSAGSVTLATSNSTNHLEAVGRFGHFVGGPFGSLLDEIKVSHLVDLRITSGLSHSKLFEFLYHRPNISQDAELALFQRTLETSWAQVLVQFAEGARVENIATALSTRASEQGESYAGALANIQLPVVQVTYGLDPMAEPEPTRETSFSQLGSAQKMFYVNAGQGHEDFMMDSRFHSDWYAPMQWLLQNR